MDHAKFMADDTRWPNWPRLPLVNRRRTPTDENPFGDLGIIFPGKGDKVTIYLTNLFATIDAKTPKVEYPTYAEAVADGWEVD